MWPHMYPLQCGTTGGRFREVLLYKPEQRGFGFACRILHPHNSTTESEQLVVMVRAMVFQTLRVYTIKEVAWKAVLATWLAVSRQWRKYGYSQDMKAMQCVPVQVSVYISMYQTGGARGSVVVKALCCKPEGRGFKSR
jgi:hypothetical protein